MKLKTLGILAAAAGVLAVPAYAHHSFAMFDFTKAKTLDGTVKDFEWGNPHSWLHVTVRGDDGKAYEWALEMGTATQISSGGWTRDSVKPGDKITVTLAPLKDGSHGGSFRSAVLANGKRLTNSGTRVSDPAR